MKKFVLTINFAFLILVLPKAGFAETGFTFTLDNKEFKVDQATLDSWQGGAVIRRENIFANPPESLDSLLLSATGKKPPQTIYYKTFSYNLAPVYSYVKSVIASSVNASVIEPKLVVENGKVVEFTPPQIGLQTDVYKTAFDALLALEKNQSQVEISAVKIQPKNSLAESNNLGISELIAQGISSFAGSPKNRRHNIKVGVEKFKGLIIAPGEEFSFNKYLGPVEKENGFLPELVIKKTGTVPELGGGLCQVSSTTFRAAMNAGLPITQRRNHAYAVQYYSPQGSDATIYPGVIDLKFVNDTPGAILVWPHFEAKDTLIFDLYGTKDGRKVDLPKPIVYDKKEDGSMKATWTRTVVTASGEEKKDVFKSIYASPALYHKTEEFISAAPAGPSSPVPQGLQMPQTN